MTSNLVLSYVVVLQDPYLVAVHFQVFLITKDKLNYCLPIKHLLDL